MKKIKLRPYPGVLWVAKTQKAFKRKHKILFYQEAEDVGYGKMVTNGEQYLIYASSIPILVHELSHAVIYLFEHVGIPIDPKNDEAFCYMLGHLVDKITKE